jgi:hypothetical protein
MSNNLPVSAEALINALAKTTSKLAQDGGGSSFLRLSKGGFFIYGADDIEVEEGSQWAVNPNSFMLGYVAWPAEGTGKPVGEEMRSITDEPLIESQLPNVGAPWAQQGAMQLMCVSGEDVGTQVIYKTSSKGGLRGFNDFLNQVFTHLSANPGTKEIVPVVELLSDSYRHQTYGKIYTPVFNIKSWTDIDSMPEPEVDEIPPEGEPDVPDEDDAPPPAARRGRAAKAETKPETPVRRRRRKAA